LLALAWPGRLITLDTRLPVHAMAAGQVEVIKT
jgi:hypothetical protein